MTTNIRDLPEYLSSPAHSTDVDSIFDQHISQIHYDQDSTCSATNFIKNEILQTIPDIVEDSDPALSPRNLPEKIEPQAEDDIKLVLKDVPDVISTFGSGNESYGETYSRNNQESYGGTFTKVSNAEDAILSQGKPTYSSSNYEPVEMRPFEQPQEMSHMSRDDQKSFQHTGSLQTNYPFPFTKEMPNFRPNEERLDPPMDLYNHMPYVDPLSHQSSQKRRLSMPFVSTCRSPPMKYPRGMRRFSAPHTTTENQRAMQYAMEARQRNNMLSQKMMYSQMSQHWLQDWDRRMGLSKAHSRTMIKTEKSRKKLQKLSNV